MPTGYSRMSFHGAILVQPALEMTMSTPPSFSFASLATASIPARLKTSPCTRTCPSPLSPLRVSSARSFDAAKLIATLHPRSASCFEISAPGR